VLKEGVDDSLLTKIKTF